MNRNLQQALTLLSLDNEDTAQRFLNYLHFADYLSPELIEKAARYLHTEKEFEQFENQSAEDISDKLKADCANFTNLETFLADFSPRDIVDLLVFLQQTAFDRNFGQERNELASKPWMDDEEKRDQFIDLQNCVGLVAEQKPTHEHYHAVGIMGASCPRVTTRINYFNQHVADSIAFKQVFAITGTRELKEGLDGQAIITTLNEQGLKANETQMVEYLIKSLCPDNTMGIIDSSPGEWHWRADTAQNAKDFAYTMIKDVQPGTTYPILLVVEQPYGPRMVMQVQRALNEAAQKYNEQHNEQHGEPIHFTVEFAGNGIDVRNVTSDTVKQSNSDFAAWLGECYKDARSLQLGQALRDPNSLMYSSRDQHYKNQPAQGHSSRLGI
jgi:hypothetical protein